MIFKRRMELRTVRGKHTLDSTHPTPQILPPLYRPADFRYSTPQKRSMPSPEMQKVLRGVPCATHLDQPVRHGVVRKKPSQRHNRLRLFHEFRFQPHGSDAIDLAVDIVIAFDQTYILDLRSHLDD